MAVSACADESGVGLSPPPALFLLPPPELAVELDASSDSSPSPSVVRSASFALAICWSREASSLTSSWGGYFARSNRGGAVDGSSDTTDAVGVDGSDGPA